MTGCAPDASYRLWTESDVAVTAAATMMPVNITPQEAIGTDRTREAWSRGRQSP